DRLDRSDARVAKDGADGEAESDEQRAVCGNVAERSATGAALGTDVVRGRNRGRGGVENRAARKAPHPLADRLLVRPAQLLRRRRVPVSSPLLKSLAHPRGLAV